MAATDADPRGGPDQTLRIRTTYHLDDTLNHAGLVHQIPVQDLLHAQLYSRRQLLDLLAHAIRLNTQPVALVQPRRQRHAA